MSALTVLQLYPAELGVNGDSGNAKALVVRARLAGLDAEHVTYQRGDALPEEVDAVVIGGGPVSAMRNIHPDLMEIAPTLKRWADDGVAFFGFASGAELLGRGIQLTDGTELGGVGVLPFRAVRTGTRAVSYVKTEKDGLTLIGFEDHASRWELDPDAQPLGYLEAGKGNQAEFNGRPAEGVRRGALVGTQIGGPLLPLNPLITDQLLTHMAQRRGLAYAPSEAHATLNRYAEGARRVILDNIDYVFHTSKLG